MWWLDQRWNSTTSTRSSVVGIKNVVGLVAAITLSHVGHAATLGLAKYYQTKLLSSSTMPTTACAHEEHYNVVDGSLVADQIDRWGLHSRAYRRALPGATLLLNQGHYGMFAIIQGIIRSTHNYATVVFNTGYPWGKRRTRFWSKCCVKLSKCIPSSDTPLP